MYNIISLTRTGKIILRLPIRQKYGNKHMHLDGCSTIQVHVCVSEEGWQKEKRAALHRAIGKRDRRQKGEKGRKQKNGKRWGRSSVKESTIVFRRRREGVCDFSATTCKKWRNMVYYTGKENISATSSGCGRRSGICNVGRTGTASALPYRQRGRISMPGVFDGGRSGKRGSECCPYKAKLRSGCGHAATSRKRRIADCR